MDQTDKNPQGEAKKPTVEWGWGDKIAPDLSPDAWKRLFALLPKRTSTEDVLILELCGIGADYSRDLLQDEFAPPQKIRTRLARLLCRRLDSLVVELEGLPLAQRLLVTEALRHVWTPSPSNQDLLGSHTKDKAAVAALAQALCNAHGGALAVGMGEQARALSRICVAAQKAAGQLDILDPRTDTDATIRARVADGSIIDDPLDPLLTACGQISRLRLRLGRGATRIRPSRGPSAPWSLHVLVGRLCQLWTRETGLKTSRAKPFVNAVVLAFCPTDDRFPKKEKPPDPVRMKTILIGGPLLSRAVGLALTDYIAFEREQSKMAPRGRPKLPLDPGKPRRGRRRLA